MVQVDLRNGEPEVATYAQHDSGEARPFGKGVDLVAGERLRPIAYVAPLSHACYFGARKHPYLIGVDDPRGDGPSRELPVVPFGDWVGWEGRWGSGERGIARRIGFGPKSPAHQGLKWRDPGAGMLASAIDGYASSWEGRSTDWARSPAPRRPWSARRRGAGVRWR
jgi:hypothetical protein